MWFRPALAAVLLLAACNTAAGDHGATLRTDIVGSATDEAGPPRRAIAAATQVGLVGFDATGHVVPELASSWRIADDGMSVIFRLRPRQWPDGKPVTASDVVAAFRRAALPASHNPLRALLTPITVDAPVDNVVEVRLAGAMPGILALLAQPDLAVMRGGPRPPPLGPFRVADATGRPIVLSRNPGAPPDPGMTLGTIALTPVADPSAAIARFAHARTDLVIGDGLAGFNDARLLTSMNAFHVEPAWGVYGYVANTRTGPLADARVRRALAMAIDRDDLGSRLFGLALAPVLGLIPPLPSEPIPALPDWAIQAPPARLDLARQLLAGAGFGTATPLTVTISLPDAREHIAVAAEVAADWARVGVKTVTVIRSPEAHALAVAHGTFELALVERTSPVDTPLAFLLPFTCGGGGAATGSSGGYCNPGADGLVTAARASPDPAAGATTLGLAEAAMVADTPLIALFAPVRWALVSPRVTGWSGNAAGQHPLALLGIARSK